MRNKKNISDKKLNLPTEGIRKRRTSETKSLQKEITKIREEINEIETKKAIEKIDETKSCFYKKINKIDKSLTRPNKQKIREGTDKVRNEREEFNQHHRNTKDHK